ncbi:ABC transporter permease subunit [Egicoccus halophilus]|uniref:Maltose/maltodextrin transport system permease protein n=1 Tax=Egicoccus halophilus TaxID=1670830 RepID=A0A8J3A5N8_9ACTN|nr:ABC transporter permease subunit [Egicoccus halophilus]GGI03787.1 sugar ABC transporter permease [Egicoccus halophilus]
MSQQQTAGRGASDASRPAGGPNGRRPSREPFADRLAARLGSNSLTGLFFKLVFLGVVNGLALYAVSTLLPLRAWTPLLVVVVATLALDAVYLSRRTLPLKFLIPGTIALLVFQVYPVLYTAYIGFTNYGTGNVLTQDQAVDRILAGATRVPEGATRFRSTPLVDDADGTLALLLTDPDGDVFLGTADGLESIDEGDVAGEGRDIVVADRFRPLTLGEAQQREDEVLDFAVPISDERAAEFDEGVNAEAISVQTFTTAAVAVTALELDEDTGNIVDTVEGVVYEPVDGVYTAEDGATLRPGFRTVVGFDNYEQVLTSPAIRGPFFRVFVWTFAFAMLSMLTTFVMGLALAMALNDPRIKGRRLTRSLLIIPYALPSFMTALIWRGLLNQSFGPVNRMFGLDVPWLSSQAYAGALPKFSILLVNLWLGFGYMFLINTGALQAIPSDLTEAAKVDGASGWQAFRNVTLPLLLVAVGPLLIASFAFNFNNFNVVFLLTGGGPPIGGTPTPAGHTDILISYSYRLAFQGGRGQDFGLAAAVSSIIFLLVAVFSYIGFKRTAVLEEIN